MLSRPRTLEPACAGYDSQNCTDAPIKEPHRGQLSCRICADEGQVFQLFSKDQLVDPNQGETFRASAWVKTAAGTSKARLAQLILRTTGTPGQEALSDVHVLTEGWTKLTVSFTTTGDDPRLDVVVKGEGDLGSCFVVDDIAVWKE